MTRYAIYYAPHETNPLWQFGSSILGFDAATFTDVAYPEHEIFQDPAALAWTAAPRRYGFHATLKAPFRLAEPATEDQLRNRMKSFAEERRPFPLTLKIATLQGFIALVEAERSAAMDRLADDCVRGFDAFRAPLTPSERERRHPDRLSAAQSDSLDRWGYPFVLDDFRFHMSLTGDMTPDDQIRLAPILDAMFVTMSPVTVIDAISLFVQEEPEGRFRLAERFAFTAL